MAQRDSDIQTQPAGKASPAPRERRISGFGSRGDGIKVHGEEPFDPHRFQTFEVTPAFRQRILEAPLPLLELRDLLADQAPPSHQRPRASANDITQPELPAAERSAEFPVLARSNPPPAEPEPPLELTQAVDRDATTAKLKPCPKAEAPSESSLIDTNSTPSSSQSPKRSWLMTPRNGWRTIAGAVGLLLLGLALAYLNKRAPVASPPDSAKSEIDVPLLPEPKPAQNPANEPKNLEAPAAAANPAQGPSHLAKSDSSSSKDPRHHATNLAKPISKPGNTKKTLWLPAE